MHEAPPSHVQKRTCSKYLVLAMYLCMSVSAIWQQFTFTKIHLDSGTIPHMRCISRIYGGLALLGCNESQSACNKRVNDIEEKYYADGEDAFDMRFYFQKPQQGGKVTRV